MALTALLLTLAQTTATAGPPRARPSPSGPRIALEVRQGRDVLGTLTLALDAEKAPLTVANFVEYVRAGHYDGTVFHRVIPGFMIQGGGYTPRLEEKPTRPPIRNEARNGLRNARGTVAMARTTGANSATSQFFVNLKDNHLLDFGIDGAGYAVFGEVIEGMDVVDRIALVPTTTRGEHEHAPQVAVVIERARVLDAPAAAPSQAEPPPAKSDPEPR